MKFPQMMAWNENSEVLGFHIRIYEKYRMIKLSDSLVHLRSRRRKTSAESWA